MHRGYIYLWRCITDNIFWLEKPFDRGRAWIDLLMLANHEDTVLWKRGIRIEVMRGQVGWSERQLSERWGWSRTKIQRFLKDLKNVHQIEPQNEPQKNNITSLITITNYNQYQNKKPQKEPHSVPQKSHRKATEDTRENTLNNIKNKTLVENSSFEEFWKVCPQRAKRCGKAEALKSWTKQVHGNDMDVIRSMIQHSSSKDWIKDNGQFIPMATTWLNQNRWTAEIVSEDDSWKIT